MNAWFDRFLKVLAKWGWLPAVFLISWSNFFCNSHPNDASPYLGHNDSVKYVGKEACKNCHPQIYATFIETGMGASFGPATRKRSSAQFNNTSVVYDSLHNLWYHPRWIGDSLFITEFRLSGKDTSYQRSERVDYIIGSGQHTNSHLSSVNGYLYQLPMTWYAQKARWDLPPGFENGRNMRFSRKIEIECMSCHNAMPEMEPGSENRFVKIPDGIDCERCHGPGELHVREKLAGRFVDTAFQIDYSIVNPRKLSWERQIDVCQRCHLQGNAVLKPGKQFTDFKPGMVLSDVVEIFMPKYEGRDDEFIMASHAQRLQQSKCFLHSNVTDDHAPEKPFQNLKLTCTTCHNPHVSVRKTGNFIFNNACQKCHAKSDCKELLQVRQNTNDNCVNCHMPGSGSVDIPHVRVHDHKIGIHKKSLSKKGSGRLEGIYSVNSKSPDARAQILAWLQYLEKFEGLLSSLDSAQALQKMQEPDENLFGLLIHQEYLRGNWNEITEQAKHWNWKTSGDAWLCYRIGQAFQNLDMPVEALEAYRLARSNAPSNLEFINKVAVAHIQLGNYAAAIQNLETGLALQPKQAEAWVNLGFAKLNQNDRRGSLEAYNKALALNPDHQQALLNRAALHNLNHEKGKAIRDLENLLRLNPQQAEVKSLLKQLRSE